MVEHRIQMSDGSAMRKETITKDFLDRMTNSLQNTGKIKEWFEFVSDTEPALATWFQEKTGSVITEFGLRYRMPMQDLDRLAFHILTAFVTGFMIKQELSADWLKTLTSSDTNDQIDTFKSGILADKFYNYDSTGLDKNSTLFKAKENYIKLKNEDVKKRIKSLKSTKKPSTPAKVQEPPDSFTDAGWFY